MYTRAIEIASEFTRPIHIIYRAYGSITPYPGAATLFMVNSDGWALTCAHVARHLLGSDAILEKYARFKAELAAGKGKVKEKRLRKEMEKKYGYAANVIVNVRNLFIDCVDVYGGYNYKIHPTADLALLRFNDFKNLGVTTFPVFAKDTADLKQGKFLCRLGYPFAEFSNFEYAPAADEIKWTQAGRTGTPRFPIEGMLTRHLLDASGQIDGFEMSTPGLKGQSGGPAIDVQGKVWGMQASTGYLDLSFDIDQEVERDGLKKRVKDYAFLHVGRCVHVETIKAFMRANGVAFQEG